MASPRRTFPALASWLVHAYTASGLVLAFLAVVAVMEGDTTQCLWLFLAAMVVDGTDGMLARWVQVKRHVPWFDGALLDNIVDYITYAFIPMVLLWSAGLLGDGASAKVLAVVPLLASAYQFCRVDAKTDDHLFLGFPSYWNIAAFYIVVLDLTPAAAAGVLLVCSVLVFVPIGYVYPSRTTTLQAPTLALTCLWLVSYAVLLVQAPDPSAVWLAVSLAYVAYYVGLSLYLTARRGRRTAPAAG
ncbi:CDP-alcohol phosphatidyltransferase family protein [Nocardioides KLBMP 9356]|uniref:Phosphatidylcholine synthase n=1 Tax=Nocardioides potassii TaxID=2911371 RepID=A0ABS9H5P1_9ACTN|nr:CDP-alcohol phosphatidyltransferase family protein [Nocardioides potassii]MCF6376570.1 CDP-alcohol phosphatidyltransferase family protein [Nocardioides potassii]